jgi:hypothetical protein
MLAPPSRLSACMTFGLAHQVRAVFSGIPSLAGAVKDIRQCSVSELLRGTFVITQELVQNVNCVGKSAKEEWTCAGPLPASNFRAASRALNFIFPLLREFP